MDIVLYSRQGCHLCHDAEQLLQAKLQLSDFRYTKIDIDNAPDLKAKYDECVPVVAIDGKVRFRGRVDPALLERFFNASG